MTNRALTMATIGGLFVAGATFATTQYLTGQVSIQAQAGYEQLIEAVDQHPYITIIEEESTFEGRNHSGSVELAVDMVPSQADAYLADHGGRLTLSYTLNWEGTPGMTGYQMSGQASSGNTHFEKLLNLPDVFQEAKNNPNLFFYSDSRLTQSQLDFEGQVNRSDFNVEITMPSGSETIIPLFPTPEYIQSNRVQLASGNSLPLIHVAESGVLNLSGKTDLSSSTMHIQGEQVRLTDALYMLTSTVDQNGRILRDPNRTMTWIEFDSLNANLQRGQSHQLTLAFDQMDFQYVDGLWDSSVLLNDAQAHIKLDFDNSDLGILHMQSAIGGLSLHGKPVLGGNELDLTLEGIAEEPFFNTVRSVYKLALAGQDASIDAAQFGVISQQADQAGSELMMHDATLRLNNLAIDVKAAAAGGIPLQTEAEGYWFFAGSQLPEGFDRLSDAERNQVDLIALSNAELSAKISGELLASFGIPPAMLEQGRQTLKLEDNQVMLNGHFLFDL